MSELELLKTLPAPLCFAGLLVYQILRYLRRKNPVVDRILEKIRRDSPSTVEPDQRLSARHVESLLKGDQHLREIAGEQDYRLLERILKQDFTLSILVIAGILVFGILTIALWIVPNLSGKLVVSNFAAVSENQNAQGRLVDLDPIEIAWQSSGKPEDLEIYLENLDTHIHSVEVAVPADAHRVKISPDQYRSVLATRNRNGVNRIRIVAQSKNAVFTSNPLDLRVGITVLTVVDGDAMLTMAAMIDHERIPYYGFEARIVIPSKTASGQPLILGNDIPYQFRKLKVAHPEALDWNNARGAYLSPDDQRLVRFEFLVDNSLRSPTSTTAHQGGVKHRPVPSILRPGSSLEESVEVLFYNGAADPEFTANGKPLRAISYNSGLATFRLPRGTYLVQAIYPNRVCQVSLAVPPATSNPTPADCHLR